MTLLAARGIARRFGRRVALEPTDLGLDAGEVVALVGPNGAGKSTLLNAIMGALPTSGHAKGAVSYQGDDVSAMPVEKRVALGMCLVPEKRELFASMTVEDNLLLGAYRRKRAGERNFLDQLEPVFELFPRLKERRKQAAGTLSGGERQMLAVGRALMGKPRLLMLDEPSLGIAPKLIPQIYAGVKSIAAAGTTVLLVEQNVREALRAADTACVLQTGCVVLHGPAAELIGLLRPAIDHLVHAWMPAAHASRALDRIWQELDLRSGFSLQWQKTVERIRDQLSVGLIEALQPLTEPPRSASA